MYCSQEELTTNPFLQELSYPSLTLWSGILSFPAVMDKIQILTEGKLNSLLPTLTFQSLLNTHPIQMLVWKVTARLKKK